MCVGEIQRQGRFAGLSLLFCAAAAAVVVYVLCLFATTLCLFVMINIIYSGCHGLREGCVRPIRLLIKGYRVFYSKETSLISNSWFFMSLRVVAREYRVSPFVVENRRVRCTISSTVPLMPQPDLHPSLKLKPEAHIDVTY